MNEYTKFAAYQEALKSLTNKELRVYLEGHAKEFYDWYWEGHHDELGVEAFLYTQGVYDPERDGEITRQLNRIETKRELVSLFLLCYHNGNEKDT